MIYKLYIQKFKDGAIESFEIIKDMIRIYRENEVIVLGHFINKDNPNETVLITVYKNQEHYNKFIQTMKNDPKYIQRQRFLKERRLSIETKTLELNKFSNIQPTEDELHEYIKDVQSILQVFE